MKDSSFIGVEEVLPVKQGLKPSSLIFCSFFLVEEVLPVKQGLKPKKCNDWDKVEEVLPVKQGLKPYMPNICFT